MKIYEAIWLDEYGEFTQLGELETETPKHWLRELFVQMMFRSPNRFKGVLTADDIMKNIIEAHKSPDNLFPNKERYYLIAKGDHGIQVLSVVEKRSNYGRQGY